MKRIFGTAKDVTESHRWCEGCSILGREGDQNYLDSFPADDPRVWWVPTDEKGENVTEADLWPEELREKVRRNIEESK